MNRPNLEKELEKAPNNLSEVKSTKLKAESLIMLLEKLEVVSFPKTNVKPNNTERNVH